MSYSSLKSGFRGDGCYYIKEFEDGELSFSVTHQLKQKAVLVLGYVHNENPSCQPEIVAKKLELRLEILPTPRGFPAKPEDGQIRSSGSTEPATLGPVMTPAFLRNPLDKHTNHLPHFVSIYLSGSSDQAIKQAH